MRLKNYRMITLPDDDKGLTIRTAISTQYQRSTHVHIDRQTDGQERQIKIALYVDILTRDKTTVPGSISTGPVVF